MKDQISEIRADIHSLTRLFDEQYLQLKDQLDKWHLTMIDRIEEMFLNTLIDLDTSYERLETFRQTLSILLDDQFLTNQTGRERILIKEESLTSANLREFSSRLSWVENEIDSISNLFFHVNCSEVKLVDQPQLIHSNTSTILPCRVLIKRESIEQLPDSLNQTLYSLLTHPSAPEVVLITNNVQQLASVIERILLDTNELRVLIHECYAPFIIGQLGNRAKILKEKYALNNIKVYPTCAPLSTERILLLSGSKHEQILECLTEIYLNMCQTPIQQATFLYSPEFYDVALADDYGGFVDRQLQLAAVQRPIPNGTNLSHGNEEEDLSGYEDEVVEDFDTNYSNETVESLRERHWTLSDAQAGALFGPNSSRLHQIRSESNAWIVIYEAEGKSTRRPMSIRGTKAEIEHATKLILETIKRHDRKLPLRYSHKRGK